MTNIGSIKTRKSCRSYIKDTAMRLVELAIAYYQDGIEGANGAIAE
jgi:hypothetical protein